MGCQYRVLEFKLWIAGANGVSLALETFDPIDYRLKNNDHRGSAPGDPAVPLESVSKGT